MKRTREQVQDDIMGAATIGLFIAAVYLGARYVETMRATVRLPAPIDWAEFTAFTNGVEVAP